MNNVLVSIITVSYNSEKTIRKTIESVLNQTYKNIEYIIIDGKSSDSTVDIAKEYEEKFDGRLKIISEPDEGIYDAMNKGIKLASGKLIGIINSDDYYESDAVQNIVNNMTKDKYQILYGELRIIENNIETQIVMTKHENINNMMIPHPTCFVTKDVYLDFGLYNTNYRSCADYEFMISKSRIKEIHFIPVYEIIATFSAGVGMSSKPSSQIECLKMKKSYHLISKKTYILELLKIHLKKILKK